MDRSISRAPAINADQHYLLRRLNLGDRLALEFALGETGRRRWFSFVLESDEFPGRSFSKNPLDLDSHVQLMN